jgi:hypothetical protein
MKQVILADYAGTTIEKSFSTSNDLEKGATLHPLLQNALKKGGEGSKGGKVIGHTKSGKPVYDHSDNKSLHSSNSHGGILSNALVRDKYSDFTHEDHEDSAKILSESSKKDKGVKSSIRKDNLRDSHLHECLNKKGEGINTYKFADGGGPAYHKNFNKQFADILPKRWPYN